MRTGLVIGCKQQALVLLYTSMDMVFLLLHCYNYTFSYLAVVGHDDHSQPLIVSPPKQAILCLTDDEHVPLNLFVFGLQPLCSFKLSLCGLEFISLPRVYLSLKISALFHLLLLKTEQFLLLLLHI